MASQLLIMLLFMIQRVGEFLSEKDTYIATCRINRFFLANRNHTAFQLSTGILFRGKCGVSASCFTLL